MSENNFFLHRGIKVTKGDDVEVTLRGKIDFWGGGIKVVTLDDSHHVIEPGLPSCVSIKVRKPQIKVGDLVTTKPVANWNQLSLSLGEGKVLAIDAVNKQAWVKPHYFSGSLQTTGGIKNMTFKLDELEVIRV